MGPGEPQASATARVTVHTNRRRPYQIIHRLEQPLLSEQGFKLTEPVLYSVSDGTHGGRSEITSLQPLTSDPTVIFSSNKRGDADQFVISYSSSAGQIIPAGSYRARVLIEEKVP